MTTDDDVTLSLERVDGWPLFDGLATSDVTAVIVEARASTRESRVAALPALATTLNRVVAPRLGAESYWLLCASGTAIDPAQRSALLRARRTEVWQLLDRGRDVAPAGERASFEITEGDGSVRLAGAVRFEPGELARALETMILADAVVMLLPRDVAAPTAEGWATTLLSGDGSTPGRSRAARLGRWVTETGARDVPLLAVHGAFDDPVLGVEIFTRSPGSFATDPPT